jgi:polar amino acid transport system permease protein
MTETVAAAQTGRARATRLTRRGPLEWLAAGVLALVLLRLLWSLMRNENLLPGAVVGHLLHPDVLAGVWLTIRLTVLVFASAWAIGLVAIWMERSGNPVLGGISAAYVWVFGSIPVLVQLLLWSNVALIFPDITFGIPGVHIDAVRLVTPVYAAIAGLALSMGAYAAKALPGGDRLTALGDLLVTTLQMTSLVSVLSITDLLGVVQALEERNHLIIPLLVVAAIWYLVLVTVARGAIRLARLARVKDRTRPR